MRMSRTPAIYSFGSRHVNRQSNVNRGRQSGAGNAASGRDGQGRLESGRMESGKKAAQSVAGPATYSLHSSTTESAESCVLETLCLPA